MGFKYSNSNLLILFPLRCCSAVLYLQNIDIKMVFDYSLSYNY